MPDGASLGWTEGFFGRLAFVQKSQKDQQLSCLEDVHHCAGNGMAAFLTIFSVADLRDRNLMLF